MKITQIDAYHVRIPLKEPFEISLGRVDYYEGVILHIQSDEGLDGWGEAACRPALFGETSQSVLGALEYLTPLLLGQDPRCLGALISRMDKTLPRNEAAKTALDVALHDLLGKAWNVPIWQFLGGARSRIRTDLTISLGSPEQMAQEAMKAVNQGFRVLKLKVGGHPQEDVKRVQAVREAVDEKITLRVDANQGWTPPQAVQVLHAIAPYNVEFVEQPVLAHDLEGLAWVRSQQPIPVMADESLCSPRDALRLIHMRAVDYFNLKLMKSGGFWRTKQVAQIAEAANLNCQVGGMLETDLGLAAAVQLACALDNVSFGDLDMGLSLKEKLVLEGGPHFDPQTGEMVTPEKPGLGIEALNEELLGNPVLSFVL